MNLRIRDTKIYFLAILIGIVSAAICLPFRYLLGEIGKIREWVFYSGHPFYFYFIVPVGIYGIMVFVYLLVRKNPLSRGSGMPQTKALLNGRLTYTTPWKSFFVKFFGGLLSIGSGLSLGREGSSVQMGSLAGDWISKLFHVRSAKRKHLIAAGAGAGVSAAFTAPLASSLLILESLERFYIPLTAITTLLAGLSAGVLAQVFFPVDIYNAIRVIQPETEIWKLLLILSVMAVFISLFGKLFSYLLLKVRENYEGLKVSPFIKIAYVAAITCLVGYFFPTIVGGDQAYMINESNIHNSGLISMGIVILVISLFTIISNAVQFPGGIFLPMMTVGGLCGKFFCLIMADAGYVSAESTGYFVLIGMSAFFISVVRTPLTGFILISEMTGHYEVFFPALLVGILTYFLTELMHVKPMDQLLYDFMIQHLPDDYPKRMTISVDVSPGSYLDGKTPATLTLPERCIIVAIYRGPEAYRFVDGFSLEAGDLVDIEIDSDDLEKIYQPLVSMAFG